MYKIVRAAGFAVAAIAAALTPTFAQPSLALATDPAAPTATHAAAPVDNPIPDSFSDVPPISDPSAALLADAVLQAIEEAETPAEPKVRLLTTLVDEFAKADVRDKEMACLAGAIYFESKGEPLAGQLAVAEVVINRAQSGRYPSTLCGVVKQPSQFSFVRGGRIPSIPKDSPHWRKAVAIAHIAINDLAESPAPHALSFHATRVSPRWKMKRVAQVGNHIFYR